MGNTLERVCDRCGYTEEFELLTPTDSFETEIKLTRFENSWLSTNFQQKTIDKTRMDLCKDCRFELGKQMLSYFAPLPIEEQVKLKAIREENTKVQEAKQAWVKIENTIKQISRMGGNDLKVTRAVAKRIYEEMAQCIEESHPTDSGQWVVFWDLFLKKAHTEPLVDEELEAAPLIIEDVMESLKKALEEHTPQWIYEAIDDAMVPEVTFDEE